MTSEEDALLAVAMGADAVGFVFAPSSRQVAAGLVRDIVRRLPPEVMTVGVFRDEAPQRVVEVVNTVGLRAAQLHGHETVEHTRLVRSKVPFVIKGFPGGDPALERADDFGADVIMLDSHAPGRGGGRRPRPRGEYCPPAPPRGGGGCPLGGGGGGPRPPPGSPPRAAGPP